jgi:hypothetical protein
MDPDHASWPQLSGVRAQWIKDHRNRKANLRFTTQLTGGTTMADDKSDDGKPDDDLINLNDDRIRGWADKLGVTVNELQVAVEKVGPRVGDVRRFLRK